MTSSTPRRSPDGAAALALALLLACSAVACDSQDGRGGSPRSKVEPVYSGQPTVSVDEQKFVGSWLVDEEYGEDGRIEAETQLSDRNRFRQAGKISVGGKRPVPIILSGRWKVEDGIFTYMVEASNSPQVWPVGRDISGKVENFAGNSFEMNYEVRSVKYTRKAEG